MTDETTMATGENRSWQALTRKQWIQYAVVAGLMVSVAFQAMTVARNNYSFGRWDFVAAETALALASSFLANCMAGMEEKGVAWAHGYFPAGEGIAFRPLSVLPLATYRAAIMCACLSAVNATAIATLIFREEVTMPAIAVIVRFLADIPQCILLNFAAYLLVSWWGRRKQA